MPDPLVLPRSPRRRGAVARSDTWWGRAFVRSFEELALDGWRPEAAAASVVSSASVPTTTPSTGRSRAVPRSSTNSSTRSIPRSAASLAIRASVAGFG